MWRQIREAQEYKANKLFLRTKAVRGLERTIAIESRCICGRKERGQEAT
jgi:hypothetical protein